MTLRSLIFYGEFKYWNYRVEDKFTKDRTVYDTEEALKESQVNYLNFEMLEFNFLRKIQILLLQSGRQI